MLQATHLHGDPLMIDYIPAGAVSAGDVVVVGNHPRIAHSDIPANGLGALASHGGVYQVPKASGAGTAIPAGKRVYWDDAANVITETEGSNKHLGFTIDASVDNDTTQNIIHLPDGNGLRMVGGVHTTVAAADTKATGLSKVVACGASLDSDPGDDPEWVSATIGDQAGAPAAGSIIIKTWKNTAGNDPTPAAATTFAKKVGWWAIGN